MVALLQSGWTGTDTQVESHVWQLVGNGCALLFLILTASVVAISLARRKRYQALSEFDASEQELVRHAVAQAETRTVGEILPVVVERSDPHPGASWLATIATTLVGTTLLAAYLPWGAPVFLILSQFALGLTGFLLSKALPHFQRLFVYEDRATAVAEEQAFQEFYANGLHKTEAATGVLLFVSLFERRVIVLADEGIDSRVAAEDWKAADDAILSGIRHGSLRDGLVKAIGLVGDRLAEHCPWEEGDRNEIPDRVIVRRE